MARNNRTDKALGATEQFQQLRQLETALEQLIEEANLSSEAEQRVRDKMPTPSKPENAGPPWEREGYESKQAWLEARNEE